MITKTLFSLLSIFLFISCEIPITETNVNKQASSPIKVIHSERSQAFENYLPEKLAVADFIDDYFNLMYDSSLQTRNNLWHSSILTHAQDNFLISDLSKGFLLAYPPKLLGIRKLKNDQFLATVDFSQAGFSLKIMNLKIAKDGLGRPYFIDLFGENIEQFQQTTSENCRFYYSPKVKINKTQEQETIAFNQKMAKMFHSPLKSIKIIALKDLKDYCEVLGYEYSPILSYDQQSGGIAMPEEDIILAANNSAHYPHEIVHLYTGDLNAHSWFDEGLATYLGGSVGHPLDYHLSKIANQVDSLDFSALPQDKKLDDDTNLKYAIGGLFCKLAYEKHGHYALFKLLNSGRTEDDFHQAINEAFHLKPEDYDTFIRTELKAYKT